MDREEGSLDQLLRHQSEQGRVYLASLFLSALLIAVASTPEVIRLRSSLRLKNTARPTLCRRRPSEP